MTLEQAIAELFRWQYSWYRGEALEVFHSHLYALIQRAGVQHRDELRIAFPEEVEAWELWASSPNPEKFFAEHGHRMAPNFNTLPRKNGSKK